MYIVPLRKYLITSLLYYKFKIYKEGHITSYRTHFWITLFLYFPSVPMQLFEKEVMQAIFFWSTLLVYWNSKLMLVQAGFSLEDQSARGDATRDAVYSRRDREFPPFRSAWFVCIIWDFGRTSSRRKTARNVRENGESRHSMTQYKIFINIKRQWANIYIIISINHKNTGSVQGNSHNSDRSASSRRIMF